jgi:hypothetical protein
MAIVQISKMQQRAGNLVDLPQLDNGELGWATDANRLFIGRSGNTFTSENIEVLTSYSAISLSQITGSDSGNLNITAAQNGQLLTYVSSTDTWENYTGNSSQLGGGKLQLGSVSNIVMGGGASGYVLQTDGLGNLTWTAQTGGSGGGGAGGSNTTVQFNDSGLPNGVGTFTFNKTSNTLTVSTGNIFTNNVYASSSMGVGTSSLSYKFQVEGGRALITPSSEAYAVGVRYNSSTNGVWLGSPSANAFQISNFGGTAYLNIDNAGNVGIGTSSPSTQLHVASGTAKARIDTTATASNNPEMQLTAVGRQFNIGVGGGTFVTTAIQGSYYVYDNTAAAYRMVVDVNGNVGIGTTAPIAKLQVVGGAIMPATGNTSSSGILFPPDPGGGTGDSAWIRNYAVTSENTVLELGTSNDTTDNIALMPSGNVGIGTRSPTQLLDISGNVTATNYLLTPSAGTYGKLSDTSIEMRASTDATPAMIFRVSSGTELMRINPVGNVGIGTTTPAVKLAVVSTDAVLLPVGSTVQRPTGANGYIRYNSQTTSFEGYSGGAWGSIGGGATGAGGDQIFYENGQTVNNSYTIATGKNAGTFGPVTIATGAVVTVPTGSVWSIV